MDPVLQPKGRRFSSTYTDQDPQLAAILHCRISKGCSCLTECFVVNRDCWQFANKATKKNMDQVSTFGCTGNCSSRAGSGGGRGVKVKPLDVTDSSFKPSTMDLSV